MSRLSDDTKHDLKVILAFCITSIVWIAVSEGFQLLGDAFLRHGHTLWASPFLIVSWLMILALMWFCLKTAWDLWHDRTNVRHH